MNENIVATGTLDETIALGGVKPFHYTFFLHYISPESNRSSCSWVIQARKADFRGLLRDFQGAYKQRFLLQTAYGILSDGIGMVKYK
jgi:hypothetical protein